ncbi:phage head closure protein, partial [Staphylococcus pseudintermedius]|nr:phage head closure protein [Staphylococcus pseudintermedius]
ASEIPVRFIIRYRDGITPKQRIKWKDLDFNIESVQNDNGKNETLTIFGKAYK